jgi:hypothetical protein
MREMIGVDLTPAPGWIRANALHPWLQRRAIPPRGAEDIGA